MNENVAELPEGAYIVHTFHHNDPSLPTVSVKAEKNTKGFNWEVSVNGTHSVAEAMKLMDEARNEMEHRFGSGVV